MPQLFRAHNLHNFRVSPLQVSLDLWNMNYSQHFFGEHLKHCFRPMRKRWLVGGAAFLVLLSTLTACRNETSSGNAVRLVRAMQLDRAVLISMQLPIRRAQLKDEASEEQKKKEASLYECVYGIDSAIFTSTIAEVIAKDLSIEEMRLAIRFFEGEVGKKYVQRDIAQLPEIFGNSGSTDKPKGEFSKEEQDVLEQFSKTTAGDKLLRQQLFHQESVLFAALAKWQDAFKACARAAQQKK